MSVKFNNTTELKGIQEVEIKTIINIYNKADNLEYTELLSILETNQIKKELLNIVLKKIFENAIDTTPEMVKLVKTLISLGADLETVEEQTGNTLLMSACFKGWEPIVELLLAECPNLKDTLNKQKKNSLFFAITSPKVEQNLNLIHLLLKNGVNPNYRENFYGDSCLSLMVKQSNLPITSLLLEYKADPNICLGEGLITPLQIACENLEKEIMRQLLINNAEIEAKNSFGMSALDIINSKILKFEGEKNDKAIETLFSMKQIIEDFIKIKKDFSEKISDESTNARTFKESNFENNKINKKKIEKTNLQELRESFFINYSEEEEKRKNIFCKRIIKESGMYFKNMKKKLMEDNKDLKQDILEKNDTLEVPLSFFDLERNIYKNFSNNLENTNNSPENQKEKIILKMNVDPQYCNDIDVLKSENKMLSNQNYVQHKTIFELHNNSSKLTEVLEYYRNELTLVSEAKLLNEERYGMKLMECNQKDEKILLLEKKLEESENIKNNLIQQNSNLENQLTEKKNEIKKLKSEVKKVASSGSTNLDNQSNVPSTIVNIETNSSVNQTQFFGAQFGLCPNDTILNSTINNIDVSKLNETLKTSSDNFGKSKNYLALKFAHNRLDYKSILKNLHKDIIDFQEYNREQIRKNHNVVEKILDNVSNLVKTFFVEIDLLVFGSYSTNLCLAWSDIDLVLVNKSGVNDPNILRKVWSLIQIQPWKESCMLVENTTIPVLKIVAAESLLNYHIDISVQDNKHFGLKCVELVKMYLREYEALEPMIISLKNILKCAGLNDPYKGGLSSYGLILLVVSYLQNQLETEKPITKEKYNLGRLFIEFLYYYGVVFDPSKYIIMTYLPNQKHKEAPQILPTPTTHDFIIVDPLNKSNNVAKSAFNFYQIKMAFSIAYMVSKEDCDCSCHWDEKFSGNQFDHCLLNRMFNAVRRCATNEQG